MLGNDFPNTLIEFEERFATEEQCQNHLFYAKYPQGYHCPKCGHIGYWMTARHLAHCKVCGHQDSIKTGTIFEGSKKPLRLWYRAIWLVAISKTGISAKNLQRQMGFSSYQTAWAWLKKIRSTLRSKNRTKLTGDVEVDETYIGGTQEGKRGRGSENKTLVCIGLEKLEHRQIGRIRMDIIEDASAESLKKFIFNSIELKSKVHTDAYPSYSFLSTTGYKHIPEKQTKENKDNLLGSIHLVVSLFKRFMLGTHQGRVSEKHMQLYLDEFVFRFNRRKSKSRGKVFYRLIDECVGHQVIPYWKLIGRSNPGIPLSQAA